MKWIQYKMHTTTDAVELLGEILCELGIQGFEISDHVPLTPEEEQKMFTDIPAAPEEDDGKAVITFYTEGDNDASERDFYSTGSSLRDEQLPSSFSGTNPEEFIAALRNRIDEMSIYTPLTQPEICYSVQDDVQWKEKWKENFQAFRVAKHLIVKPVWQDIPNFATEQDILIQIDPGSAFGTGTHETTKLCMTSLTRYIRSDTTILDAGCGSGILAISALLSGAKSAFCLDIDPSAVSATKANASLNHIAEKRFQAIQGNILEDADKIHDQIPYVFDVAVANILADVIIPLAEVIRPFIKDNGIFISSGILTEKADDVKKALQKNHFTILEENTLGEWVSFVAQKR
jgi:ribosomal protein L11 methyltransferase